MYSNYVTGIVSQGLQTTLVSNHTLYIGCGHSRFVFRGDFYKITPKHSDNNRLINCLSGAKPTLENILINCLGGAVVRVS